MTTLDLKPKSGGLALHQDCADRIVMKFLVVFVVFVFQPFPLAA
jgi:hypothetical protein